jgi:hypothetical protein
LKLPLSRFENALKSLRDPYAIAEHLLDDRFEIAFDRVEIALGSFEVAAQSLRDL